MKGAADVADPQQPTSFSSPVTPSPLGAASPPHVPVPPPERIAGSPQPVSALSVSPSPPPAQQLGDIPIQQVKKPLVVQYGPTLQSYNSLPVTIGSGAQCDFRLDHPAVFERHAQIFYCQEHYWIKDLTGKNLVQINGRSVEGQGMLEPDHRLSLSAQGPDFKFLGEGRLAEIEAAVPEESQASPHQKGGDATPGFSQGNAVKQIGAMMKKMLKR